MASSYFTNELNSEFFTAPASTVSTKQHRPALPLLNFHPKNPEEMIADPGIILKKQKQKDALKIGPGPRTTKNVNGESAPKEIYVKKIKQTSTAMVGTDDDDVDEHAVALSYYYATEARNRADEQKHDAELDFEANRMRAYNAVSTLMSILEKKTTALKAVTTASASASSVSVAATIASESDDSTLCNPMDDRQNPKDSGDDNEHEQENNMNSTATSDDSGGTQDSLIM